MELVPQNLVRPVRDGETVEVLGHRIGVLYTPGHASHHVSYLLNKTRMFTGDAAGIRLPGAETVRPALPPPELDLESWRRSIGAVEQAGPDELLLTHFGPVGGCRGAFSENSSTNTAVWSESILEGMNAGEDDETLAARIGALSRNALLAEGASAGTIERHSVTSSDAMTVMSLKRYWQKVHPERLESPSQ